MSKYLTQSIDVKLKVEKYLVTITTMKFLTEFYSFKIQRKFVFKFIIDIFSTFLTTYILYEIFEQFLSKPTFFTNYKEKLQPRHFPDIFVCPLPSFNLSGLVKHGYMNGYYYSLGEMGDSKLRGWNGNSSTAPGNVLQDISTWISVEDCPKIRVLFEDETLIYMNMTLARMTIPQGLCCQPIISDEAGKSGVVYIAVIDERGKNSAKGFQVYFASQRSSHVLKINNFNTKGQIFRAYEKDTVYTVWKIKVFEELLLEDDLKNPCKNYPKKKDYSKV